MQPEHWTCGHVATAMCSECHQLLARKAQKMVELIDDMREDLTAEQRDTYGRRLNEILSATT